MEFLVRIQVDLPPSMPEAERQELLGREALKGREYIEAGALRRIWRIPGRVANFSLYEAQDATELHALLSELPLWPWISADVQALAVHPLESTTANV
jgi:muconolactone D-isomerase